MRGRKTGGRRRGSANKATVQIRELARALTLEDPAFVRALRARLRKGTEAAPIVLELLRHGYGVPTQKVVGRFTLEELITGKRREGQ